jgi:hypothetical protein
MSESNLAISAEHSPVVTPNNSPVSDIAIACSIDTAPLELPPSPVADSNDSDKFSVDLVEEVKQADVLAEAIDAVKDTIKVVKEPIGCLPKTMKIVKGLSKFGSLIKGLISRITYKKHAK